MPRLIDTDTTGRIELAELVDTLAAGGFDPDDEDSIAAFGPALRKLGNNRRFLGDLVVEELKRGCADQVERNQYTAQVILLHIAPGFAIRANFWPAAHDSVVVNSGVEPFFYGVPHDHNFSFLTVGYLGPGYWSEYYEYDYGQVVGIPGEKVDLKFVEKARLEQGKVMLYRAHRDVHNQLPADDMSVSINIMAASNRLPFLSQYEFDPRKCEIVGILTRSSSEALLALAAHHGGD
ncbi:MAG TPA: transposase, partial [Allosphingosinicella sp.]